MSDGFLGRWSRRKREVIEAEAKTEVPGAPLPDASLEENEEPDAETAEAIAALPPIESLTAETDLGQFLRVGIPRALRNAALRRMWSLDPSIRDYLCEAREYAYDWNVVGGVPGQGPLLPTDDVEAMLRQVFAGTDAVEAEPEPGAGVGTDTAEPGEMTATEGVAGHRERRLSAGQVERGFPLAEWEGQSEGCDPSGESTPLTPTLSPQKREPFAVPAHSSDAARKSGGTEVGEPKPTRVRRHGGAVPI